MPKKPKAELTAPTGDSELEKLIRDLYSGNLTREDVTRLNGMVIHGLLSDDPIAEKHANKIKRLSYAVLRAARL